MTMQYKTMEPPFSEFNSLTGWNIKVDQFNQRLVIEDLGMEPAKSALDIINGFGDKVDWLGKTIIFARDNRWPEFVSQNFRVEGYLNHFFETGVPAVIVSKFYDPGRARSKDFLQEDGVLEKIFVSSLKPKRGGSNREFRFRTANGEDAPRLASFFKKIFEVYPTPVFDPDYLRRGLEANYLFRMATCGDEIVSVASAEMDNTKRVAEITDCATLPLFRGQGLMQKMVVDLEKEMRKRSFRALFSLSRAREAGINRVLYNLGFRYQGRLVNNCLIASGFEDMNVWEKTL